MPGFAYETVATRVVRQFRAGVKSLRAGRLPDEVETRLLRLGITPPRPAPTVEMGEPPPFLQRLWRNALLGVALALFLLSMGALSVFVAQLLASYLLLTRGLGLRVDLGRPA